MEDLPYVLTRDYLVSLKYRLGLRTEDFEAEKENMTAEKRAKVRTSLVRERLRIDKLDQLFGPLSKKLEEYLSIVDLED